jgi:hypothetical protein
MVETLAKAQYPQGIDLLEERDPRRAFERTRELIESAENSVIFEGAALFGKFYARVDILRRDGKTLHLIEVKPSSWSVPLKSWTGHKSPAGRSFRWNAQRRRSRSGAFQRSRLPYRTLVSTTKGGLP